MKKLPSLVLLAGLLSLQSGSAAISVFAQYRLGEDDPVGHTVNDGPVIDSSGNGRNMESNVGEGTVQLSTSTPISGSSAYYDFQGRGFYVDGVFASWDIYQSNNVGIELWVKASDLGQTTNTIFNASGMNLTWQGGANAGFGASFGGNAIGNVYSPSSVNEWVHLALVRDSGTTVGADTTTSGATTFYVNGVAFGSTVNTDSAGNNSILLGVTANAVSYFDGSIDEARIFTFAPNEFASSDLMIPEPSVAILGLAGVVGFSIRRRRN